MKILSYWLLFLLLLSNSLYAQEGDLNPTKFKVIPPAPNAAALGKYGDIPVSLSNGLPNISVPLTKIAVGNEFNMDIDLSYHASGMGVAEVATYVGLGWSMNAGGAITRVIKGKPDEAGYVGQNGYSQIPLGWQTDAVDSTYERFRLSADGTNDTQPDEFSYNFGGNSGKFVFGANYTVYTMPYHNIKIEAKFDLGNMYFTVTTENGTIYIFKNPEITETVSACSTDESESINSWYLTSVILPQSKRRIEFTYIADPGFGVSSTSQTLTTLNTLMPIDPLVGCPTSPYQPVFKGCISTSTTQQTKVKRIDYPGGRIDFNYTYIRSDLSNTAQDTFYALGSVVESGLLNGTYNPVRRFTFDYNNLIRLQLRQVNNADIYGNTISSYKVTYNTAHGFPALDSRDQDHWGGYNGAGNTTLIPGSSNTDGANREPDADYIQTGIIQKIEFPTGGYSTFEFENNTYGRFNVNEIVHDPTYQTLTTAKEIRTGYYSAQIIYPNYASDSVSFTLDTAQSIITDVTLQSCCGNYARISLKKLSDNTLISIPTGHNYTDLTAGQYRMYIESGHDEPTANYEKVQLSLKYKHLTGYTGIARGGGLRIKRITSYDGINHSNDIIKTYLYRFGNDSTRSTGWLYTKPDYEYSFTKMCPPATSTGGFQEYACPTKIKSSSANNEMMYSHGSSINYLEVVEATNENGSTRYVYYLSSDANAYVSYPFTPFTNNYPSNGMEAKKLVYDNTGKLLRKTETTYETYLKGSILGWKAAYILKGHFAVGPGVENFLSRKYSYNSFAAVPQSVKQTEYFGTDSIVNTTDMTYDNKQHYQPTRIHKVNSKKDDLWIYNKYPTDYIIPSGTLSSGLQALKMMQDSNIHSTMIEQYVQQVRAGVTTTLSAAQVQYKTNIQGVVMAGTYKLKRSIPLASFTPTYIQNNDLVRDSNYEQELSFDTYDSTGNIREQHMVNDVNEVYIWGYSNLYPVARITGSTYAAAISFVNMNVLRNPSSDAVLRVELNKIRTGLVASNALVSTYTYQVGVGVTSETDPTGKTVFYEYDRLGRLKLIRDMDGKILKQFSYQFFAPVNL
ncbi:YD repeat-containing protein [Chitinophaga sp. YR573]|uniref:RHS repeat protein n=1 Tax=Chitinophaga sp. YR573 TaxID=1881040 RepID=UPI0008CCA855|nr:RHS repeat protein [Chitinophaga sp. YR573]SEW36249.1 YD repeat-containing protein [Chitinophaga sp. YR573]